MTAIQVIHGPQIAWRRGEQTGIEIGFRLCGQETRRVRLDWRLTDTSGVTATGRSDPLPLGEDSCVHLTAVVPPEDLTVVWTLRDDDRPAEPLWQGTSYLSVAGYEATLIPSPGRRLEHTGPLGAGMPISTD
jgi:hypothetical protein